VRIGFQFSLSIERYTYHVYFVDFPQIFSKGLYAPLCIQSKELPSADGLRPRMTTIAYESGLMGGVNEEVLEAMALALEVNRISFIQWLICLPLSTLYKLLIVFMPSPFYPKILL
jgi:Transcriptional regulator of RNA polII, SAGA, subunit